MSREKPSRRKAGKSYKQGAESETWEWLYQRVLVSLVITGIKKKIQMLSPIWLEKTFKMIAEGWLAPLRLVSTWDFWT